MASLSSSSTSSSEGAGPRLVATLGWAIAAVLALNLLVGLRLEPLLRDSQVASVKELDARVARFPAPEKVQVLVLGNSHAQHNLRPPSLGPALGLAPDEVFNLALPSATALEMRLIAHRHAARFPRARRALVGVDEVLLMILPWFADHRIRFQTRHDPAWRWRYAGYMPDLERRVGALAWMPLPLGDFAPALRDELRDDPRRFVRRLALGDTGLTPGTADALAAAQDYRWGYPPKADVQPDTEAGRKHFALVRMYFWLANRAQIFFGAPAAIDRALEDLEATCRALEARGIEVTLVAPVYTWPLRYHIAHERAPEKRRFEAALAEYLRTSGRTIVAPTGKYPDTAFIDADHLSSVGARVYAEDLARQLRRPRR